MTKVELAGLFLAWVSLSTYRFQMYNAFEQAEEHFRVFCVNLNNINMFLYDNGENVELIIKDLAYYAELFLIYDPDLRDLNGLIRKMAQFGAKFDLDGYISFNTRDCIEVIDKHKFEKIWSEGNTTADSLL